MESDEIKKLVADLKGSNQNARLNATIALEDAAYRGVDVSLAIPVLAGALCDSNRYIVWNAAWALELAAKKGSDISSSINNLKKLISDDLMYYAKDDATEALTYHYLNKRDFRNIISLLNYKDVNIKSCVIYAIGVYAKKGFNITPLSSNLRRFLLNTDVDVRRAAAYVFIEFADKNKQNAALVLKEIKKVKKNISELKEVIKKCEEVLKK